MLSENEICITRVGKVIVEKERILIQGFEADDASCRELVVLAAAWAIGELQREMLKTIERPGGGNFGMYEPEQKEMPN
ncbi:hypothetical protein [Pseudomonas soli]|uniref:hypothetical protein n=1 Tax=Pseudomonas soli TaxID=1306993 RepID=UPI0021AD0698|nr:hypothetical protein [Pseudomonas soli]